MPANLLLSNKELQLVSDDEWIRMKEIILNKVAGILGTLPPLITEQMEVNLPDFKSYCLHSPKISRGERYQGLPYLILDYPREFGKEDVFALRTMFWWAHYFSISLQLAGEFRKEFEERLIANFESHENGLYLCIHEDPWQHEVSDQYFVSVRQMGLQRSRELLRNHPFIKVTLTIPLNKWNNMEAELIEGYRRMSGLLA